MNAPFPGFPGQQLRQQQERQQAAYRRQQQMAWWEQQRRADAEQSRRRSRRTPILGDVERGAPPIRWRSPGTIGTPQPSRSSPPVRSATLQPSWSNTPPATPHRARWPWAIGLVVAAVAVVVWL